MIQGGCGQSVTPAVAMGEPFSGDRWERRCGVPILYLTVTQASTRSCCITGIRANAAWGTILRILHEMSNLVFPVALTLSYYEAIKTHRDEFTCLIPTANSPPCSVANRDLLSVLSRGNHAATDKALHGLAPAHLSSVITFLPLPIPHLGCGELHSGLQMFYIFCCLRAFACVSSAWNNPSLTPCARIVTTQTSVNLDPAFSPSGELPHYLLYSKFFFCCLSHNILLYCIDRCNCWFPPLDLRLSVATLCPENMEPVIERMISKYFLRSERWMDFPLLCFLIDITLPPLKILTFLLTIIVSITQLILCCLYPCLAREKNPTKILVQKKL